MYTHTLLNIEFLRAAWPFNKAEDPSRCKRRGGRLGRPEADSMGFFPLDVGVSMGF